MLEVEIREIDFPEDQEHDQTMQTTILEKDNDLAEVPPIDQTKDLPVSFPLANIAVRQASTEHIDQGIEEAYEIKDKVDHKMSRDSVSAPEPNTIRVTKVETIPDHPISITTFQS